MIRPRLQVIAQQLQEWRDTFRFDSLDSEWIDTQLAGVLLDLYISLLQFTQRAQSRVERSPFCLSSNRFLGVQIMERLVRHGMVLPSVGGAASPTVRAWRRQGPNCRGQRLDILCSVDWPRRRATPRSCAAIVQHQ